MLQVIFPAALMLVSMLVLAIIVTRQIKSVPPDRALVITGRKRFVMDPQTGERRIIGFRVITGGSAFVIPIFERTDYLPLAEMQIAINADDLRDQNGDSQRVSLVVNCRISDEGEMLTRAIGRFLGMSIDDIREIAATTIEARLMNQVLVADLRSRGTWAGLEREVEGLVGDDLKPLGIEVDNLIFRDRSTTLLTAVTANGRGESGSE